MWRARPSEEPAVFHLGARPRTPDVLLRSRGRRDRAGARARVPRPPYGSRIAVRELETEIVVALDACKDAARPRDEY
jgi:hypothetical protein